MKAENQCVTSTVVKNFLIVFVKYCKENKSINLMRTFLDTHRPLHSRSSFNNAICHISMTRNDYQIKLVMLQMFPFHLPPVSE